MHTQSSSLSVLITRPQGQGQALADKLNALGFTTLLFPTLVIEPKQLTPVEQRFVEGLDLYSHIICVSANAAKMGIELLADYWPQWPVEQQWVAVGPATNDAMQGWGIGEVQCPSGASHSEGVLALESLQQVADKKILILRGVSGRELMADTLRKRGASVDYLELYERKIPSFPGSVGQNSLAQWLCSNNKNAIVVTSGDGLKNLQTLAAEVEQSAALLKTSLVVVSQRLADFAQQKGFANVWLADGASDEAIVRCLESNAA